MTSVFLLIEDIMKKMKNNATLMVVAPLWVT